MVLGCERKATEGANGSEQADHRIAIEETENQPKREIDGPLCKSQKDREAENTIGHRIEQFA